MNHPSEECSFPKNTIKLIRTQYLRIQSLCSSEEEKKNLKNKQKFCTRADLSVMNDTETT